MSYTIIKMAGRSRNEHPKKDLDSVQLGRPMSRERIWDDDDNDEDDYYQLTIQ